MPSVADVEAIVAELPEVVESTRWGNRSWAVGPRAFAWERPFSKADIKRYGRGEPPAGPILAVRVDDLGEKEAVLAEGRRGVFTIEHFDGYAAVLVQLSTVGPKVLRELVISAWLWAAPASLGDAYLADHPPRHGRR